MIALDPPVVPDAETARGWAEEELARAEYAEGGGSWLQHLLDTLSGWLEGWGEGVGASLGPVGTVAAVVAALAAVAGVTWLVMGPLRRGRRGTAAHGLFADERGADSLEASARHAADAGDWATATTQLYRALIRRLAERRVITLTAGVTAHEAATAAAAAVPTLADRVTRDADAFDALRYGGAVGDARAYAHVRETYRSAREARRRTAGAGTAP